MNKRLLGALLCYAVTMLLLQHFLPEYWGRITLAVFAMDMGACYVRSLMWKRQMVAAMERAALEQALDDEMEFDDESF